LAAFRVFNRDVRRGMPEVEEVGLSLQLVAEDVACDFDKPVPLLSDVIPLRLGKK
jgi:hypothetical protein